MGTKEFGKMMKRIQILEEARVPSQRGKELENRKRKEKNCEKRKRPINIFEMDCLMAQKGLWNLEKEKIMKGREELPKEEGDAVREYKAMHEEDFWSNWLRKDRKVEQEKTNLRERKKKEKREKKGE